MSSATLRRSRAKRLISTIANAGRSFAHWGIWGRKVEAPCMPSSRIPTYNYRAEVTGRQIERLPPWPISCPKLRELHPEAAAVGTCKCQFDLRGRAYPTPVLYALRVSEVPVFRTSPARPAASRDEAASEADTLRRAAEEKVGKIAELKRHRRGIEAALERLQSELATLFDNEKCETLQLSLGALRRVRRSEGEGWEFVIEV
jgi:hypothetical protein